MPGYVEERFTEEERSRLAPHFTDLDGPVFALTNLPEVVKGALFARYSRSAKSLRRLFLDEFSDAEQAALSAEREVGTGRAERLYRRVFFEYGDDSVAQLGGVHLACEQVSQPLAKVLERGRLAAYLEQSTRYVPYDDRPGGRWRYHVPEELNDAPELHELYVGTLDRAFQVYSSWLGPMQALYRELHPRDAGDSDAVYASSIRAKACDALRGLLPAATRTNVGIFATAQTYEHLLLRMRADERLEVRSYGERMLSELRKVIPAFLTRVDLPDRGGRWVDYLSSTRRTSAEAAARVTGSEVPDPRPDVTLTDYDPEGEIKVVAAALYAGSTLPDDRLLDLARGMSGEDRAEVLRVYVGDRTNRRHKPGRAFERTAYRFDVLCDYGAFRDLQRHRQLTIEWQELTPAHGFEMPPEVEWVGARRDWEGVMAGSASLYEALDRAGHSELAQYAVSMAYRIRFYMQMNAREAMHVIELRTSPQGHPTYRRVCQRMHTLIAEGAGHRAIAEAIRFADHRDATLSRLESERRTEAKRLEHQEAGQ